MCRLSLCNLLPVAAFSIFSADPDLSACIERGSPASSETELYIPARTERGCRARDRPVEVVPGAGGSIGGVVLELERELARLRSLTCTLRTPSLDDAADVDAAALLCST